MYTSLEIWLTFLHLRLDFSTDPNFTRVPPTPLPQDYEVRSSELSASTYCSLRDACALSPRTLECAEIGLKNSLYCCSIVHLPSNQVIGMGRLVGDGGCFVNIYDIAVLPTHQKQGLGKIVMEKLMDWIKNNVPKGAFVGLYGHWNAQGLYEKYGFRQTGPYSVGMGVRT